MKTTQAADAMAAIRQALAPFSPEERMVLVSGLLGGELCKIGSVPSRTQANMLAGSAMRMVFDMIDRTFGRDDTP